MEFSETRIEPLPIQSGNAPRNQWFGQTGWDFICDILSKWVKNDPPFFKQVVFSDECKISQYGFVNEQTYRAWGWELPNEVFRVPSCRSSVMVWCPISETRNQAILLRKRKSDWKDSQEPSSALCISEISRVPTRHHFPTRCCSGKVISPPRIPLPSAFLLRLRPVCDQLQCSKFGQHNKIRLFSASSATSAWSICNWPVARRCWGWIVAYRRLGTVSDTLQDTLHLIIVSEHIQNLSAGQFLWCFKLVLGNYSNLRCSRRPYLYHKSWTEKREVYISRFYAHPFSKNLNPNEAKHCLPKTFG